MTLEAIMTEIRDELKRSNDLKAKQLQDFTDISNEPAGWTQMPAEEKAEENEQPVVDESEMKKAVAKIIKGTDTDKKDKLKEKIKEIGAKKVSDIKPEQRQIIIDYIEEL